MKEKGSKGQGLGPTFLSNRASRLVNRYGAFVREVSAFGRRVKDPEQLELLREFMKLQKDMMIMLLSMLEGLRADVLPITPDRSVRWRV